MSQRGTSLVTCARSQQRVAQESGLWESFPDLLTTHRYSASLNPHVSLHNRCVLGPGCWLAAPTAFSPPAALTPGALLHRVMKPLALVFVLAKEPGKTFWCQSACVHSGCRYRPSLTDSFSLLVGQEASPLRLAGLEPMCLHMIPRCPPFAMCCWQELGGCFPNFAAPKC